LNQRYHNQYEVILVKALDFRRRVLAIEFVEFRWISWNDFSETWDTFVKSVQLLCATSDLVGSNSSAPLG